MLFSKSSKQRKKPGSNFLQKMATEGVYITCTEWNQQVKKIDYMEQYLINSANHVHKSKWIKPAEDMDVSRPLYKLPRFCEWNLKGFEPIK